MLTYQLTASLDGAKRSIAAYRCLGLVKVPVALAIYTLIATFGLMAAFLGILVLMSPVCIRGIQFLVQTPIPSDEMELGSSQWYLRLAFHGFILFPALRMIRFCQACLVSVKPVKHTYL